MHACKRVENTRSLNSIMSTDSNVWSLYTREYSCIFPNCIDENYDGCINEEHGYVGEWTLVPLDVINTNEFEDEKNDDIRLISNNYDHILELTRVGMYFITFLNIFYIYTHVNDTWNLYAYTLCRQCFCSHGRI